MPIPSGLSAIHHASQIVKVTLDDCRDTLAYGYTGDGWHYLAALIREYIRSPDIRYSDSVLRAYYDRFQPRSFIEALCTGTKQPPDLPGWPPLPWFSTSSPPKSNHQHFGPNTDSFGLEQFNRTIAVYKRLLREGYQPNQHSNGYIRGYFLQNGDDFRFIVTAGQHRIAALAIIGYRKIAVKIQPGFPRFVDLAGSQAWPSVASGLYTAEQAAYVFRFYFQTDGSAKAKKLKLYDRIYPPAP